ncbi:G protein-coupled receptor 34 like [Huso huso]|uniref:G protein-coupled receptor 34 like n=1 Tax=Huso huso TaxID=61971 RepID=A0ABR0YMR2_HUSHU
MIGLPTPQSTGLDNSTEAYALSHQKPSNNCELQDGILSVVLPVSYSVICILGLLSNSVALWVFTLNYKSTKTSIIVYMRNLAIADFLLVLCLPLRIYYQNHPGPFLLCQTVGAFFYINMYASILFLGLISLDRFLKITRPVQLYQIHKVSCSIMATRAVWLFLILGMLPFFFEKRKPGLCDGKCFHFKNKTAVSGTLNLLVVGMFFLLLLLFFSFYSKIAMKLKSMSIGKTQQSRKTAVIMKTFVVLAIFILCFLPYHIVRIPYVLSQLDIIQEQSYKQTLHIANELVLCLSALNSCLDPVIYFFLSIKFRKTILCAFEGKLKKVYTLNQRGTSFVRSVTEI